MGDRRPGRVKKETTALFFLRIRRRIQQQFQEFQVQPAPEFIPDLSEMGDFLKAEGPVQAEAGIIGSVHTGNDRMQIPFLCSIDQRRQQEFADPFSPLVSGYIDRVFYRIFIGGPGPERAERTEACQPTLRFGGKDGIAVFLFGFEPGAAHLLRMRVIVIHSRGMKDDVVIDRKDLRQIGLPGWSDGYGGCRHGLKDFGMGQCLTASFFIISSPILSAEGPKPFTSTPLWPFRDSMA